jgi:hypothetical protein
LSGFLNGNELALEIIREGAVVGRNVFVSSPFNQHPSPSLEHDVLSIAGIPFDYARMISTGPVDTGMLLFRIDNVALTPVPEPEAAMLCSALIACIRAVRRRRVGHAL